MPSAPNLSQSVAAFATLGILPPRAFLTVAILFMLTLSLVIVVNSFLFWATKLAINFNFCKLSVIFEAVLS